MALDIVVQSLLQVDLFAGLKPLQVAELARRSDRIVYKPGDMIITEGAIGDAAVLIIKGDAIRISGPSLMEPMEPIADGSLLGEMAMLIETAHTSTVIARAMTRAIRITRDAVCDQIAADRALADHLSHTLARRLNAMSRQLREIDDTFALMDEPFFPALAGGAPSGQGAQIH
ncbi:MAG: cyclic nucleotide-binding domain-containing protein [Hyphomicrobiaceae bacterium]